MSPASRSSALGRAAAGAVLVAAVIAAMWAYFFMWRTVSIRSHAADKTLVVWLEMDGSASRQLVLDAGARDSTFVWGRPSRDTSLGVFALQSRASSPIGSCGHQGRWSPALDYIVIVTEPEEGELIAWCERASTLDAVLSVW
ncbi:hypothetical protein [Sorangium sp. So ce861]|uniref:hypothetical protein n=1 Tax=Sorangium sp. So ce861 TaxID=3133323 RepID=UPI003F62640C